MVLATPTKENYWRGGDTFQSATMNLCLLLLLLPPPLLASLGFPLTMPYVRPQLPQVAKLSIHLEPRVFLQYINSDIWSKIFSFRASHISALGWPLTLHQSSTSLPSPLLPQGTRWLNLLLNMISFEWKFSESLIANLNIGDWVKIYDSRCITWWSLAAALQWVGSPPTFGTAEEGAAFFSLSITAKIWRKDELGTIQSSSKHT